ncbi:hypothetical protein [Vulcanisaeta distributa]|uniref:Uncharacterized protein n=1 Tax=Vulcanisaeta distributa (strain DSM 14429 / JCM 11212 / NBRC 100878 / IC-017) TaxID=572478 RepID=E1QSN7_VULDI|nr:hypothetical protein [Vulcanisaeta distributa]ADN49554.1 hypothetical protein Vdis_0141 [Vulcanisaeta distributa DSM 14429]
MIAVPLRVGIEIKKEYVYSITIVNAQNHCDVLRNIKTHCESTYGRGHPACQGLETAINHLCKT